MDTNHVGKLLMEKGKKFYELGKTGIGSFFGGLALAAFICLISLAAYGQIYFFDGYVFTGVMWFCAFLLTGAGVLLAPLYFIGLHYMGLGRLNQYNEAICRRLGELASKPSDELPDL